MPQRTNPFQELIFNIEKALSGSGTSVKQSVLVKDQLGIDREIDVLIQAEVNQVEIRIAVECRDYSRDQSITWIDEIVGKYASLPVDKVIAVSSNGFTDSAIAKANQYNIVPLSLEQALARKWPDVLSDILIMTYRLQLMLTNLGFDIDGDTREEFEKDEIVYDKAGNKISNLFIEADRVYEEVGRIGVTEEIRRTNPDFFEYGSDKCCILDFTISDLNGIFIKNASGVLYRVKEFMYRVRCEICFIATENSRGFYKNTPVIRAISKVEGKKAYAYAAPIQKDGKIQFQLFGNEWNWKRVQDGGIP